MWNDDGSYTIKLTPGMGEVRLSGALIAQTSDEEIRRQLRRLYEGMYRKRATPRVLAKDQA